MTSNRWKGKCALVTGASSGIGEGIALKLAGMGMKVAIAARRLERLNRLQERLIREGAEGVLVLSMDMRDEESVIEGFRTLKSQWETGVHVLINNAGLGVMAPLMSGETEAWRNMLEVNVLGLSIATREGVQQMTAHGDLGHIIHVSSMSAHRVPGGSGMYSASKYAVRALTEGLRKELRAAGSPIRISSISPGFVETEFAEKYHQSRDAADEVYGRYPVLQIEDMGETVAFLLESPEHMEVHDILIRPTQQDS